MMSKPARGCRSGGSRRNCQLHTGRQGIVRPRRRCDASTAASFLLLGEQARLPRSDTEAVPSLSVVSSADKFPDSVVLAASAGAASCATAALASPCLHGVALAMLPPAPPWPRLGMRRAGAPQDPEQRREDRAGQAKVKLHNVLSAASFVALVPGLTLTLFTAKAVQEFDLGPFGKMTIPLMVFSKSTLGTVHHLANTHYFLPAGLIVLFSVAIPAGKAAIMASLAALGGDPTEQGLSEGLQRRAMTIVRGMAKWAHVDALCAATLVGGLSGVVPQLTVGLHEGFYCFVGYCALSTCAALAATEGLGREGLLPRLRDGVLPTLPEDGPLEDPESVDVGPMLMDLGSCLAAAAVVIKGVTTPLISFGLEQLYVQSHQISLLEIANRLFNDNDSFAGMYLVVGTCVVPMLDLAAAALRVRSSNKVIAQLVWHPAVRALGEFALLDVCLASLVVTRLATSGLSGNMSVNLSTTGLGCLVGYAAVRLALELAAVRAQARPHSERVVDSEQAVT